MPSEPSTLSSDADKEVGNDQHPWICPGCGHFIVRRGPSENPSHPCAAAGTSVEFVPYLDNEQALSIRRSIGRSSGAARPAGMGSPVSWGSVWNRKRGQGLDLFEHLIGLSSDEPFESTLERTGSEQHRKWD